MKNQENKVSQAVRLAFTTSHGKPVATPVKSHGKYLSPAEQKNNLKKFIELLQKWQDQKTTFEHRLDEISRIVRKSPEYNASTEEQLYFETMIGFFNLMTIRINHVNIKPL